MRLTTASVTSSVGNVHIHSLQRVVELDSGSTTPVDDGSSNNTRRDDGTVSVSTEDLRAIEAQLVIVVPCMNEDISTIEGVLSSIPHRCLIILVSNSSTEGARDEVDLLQHFCKTTGRSAVAIHQRDPGAAAALKQAGLPELLDDAGLIRNGKGEAMLLGLVLAATTTRKYIGFIDADNFVPGSVHEYCKVFAAGLHLASQQSDDVMVRISWASKPKVQDGQLIFGQQGRSSRIVNSWLNRLLVMLQTGDDSPSNGTDEHLVKGIATGNAGEHAMSISLALKLRLASGYAIEPFHFLDVFEQFGSSMSSPENNSSVHIYQIQTRNPHLHDAKDDKHIERMWAVALSHICHSHVSMPAGCSSSYRTAVARFMVDQGVLRPG
ncbi:putative mannosyl-3-phosphoglycerate synthase protein [Phaeoacremonium minimum UCRPA7]|uniref:Putative mannosyl-3-phosphoglycerate synthase protein n=1 Tax=Phaeoacremonium minimum (strain UCR-PA7) TaxID=1286976 RepID=R8BWD2_PHAM7|nr:putative mannosyl-3-phosphoglycerate synthase protein [Phaeoacremonium minimum UCRPA7]EOO03686.1 putative mannosyl-3-phosphoglycerate synthase protein [Phaeoacremonium minimum UCRPA7]